RRLAESRHQSCLLLTSRETPPRLRLLEADAAAVRSFELSGLEIGDARALLRDKQLAGDAAAWAALVERYMGNGLALMIAGESIRRVFGGDIAAFLEGVAPVFGDIRRVLDEQLARLSGLEQ